jgi:hypothetical protein
MCRNRSAAAENQCSARAVKAAADRRTCFAPPESMPRRRSAALRAAARRAAKYSANPAAANKTSNPNSSQSIPVSPIFVKSPVAVEPRSTTANPAEITEAGSAMAGAEERSWVCSHARALTLRKHSTTSRMSLLLGCTDSKQVASVAGRRRSRASANLHYRRLGKAGRSRSVADCMVGATSLLGTGDSAGYRSSSVGSAATVRLF